MRLSMLNASIFAVSVSIFCHSAVFAIGKAGAFAGGAAAGVILANSGGQDAIPTEKLDWSLIVPASKGNNYLYHLYQGSPNFASQGCRPNSLSLPQRHNGLLQPEVLGFQLEGSNEFVLAMPFMPTVHNDKRGQMPVITIVDNKVVLSSLHFEGNPGQGRKVSLSGKPVKSAVKLSWSEIEKTAALSPEFATRGAKWLGSGCEFYKEVLSLPGMVSYLKESTNIVNPLRSAPDSPIVKNGIAVEKLLKANALLSTESVSPVAEKAPKGKP